MRFFIPQTMKNIDNWVVWKKEGKEYIKKVPYDPRTGRRADPTKSCCCYEDAISFYKNSNTFDGIGFCFTKSCNMTFIDIDHCINENGEESLLAKEIKKIFSDCYIEYSQSHRGIHIICLGTIPRSIKTKEIEIYSYGRYVALTGNSINLKEPQNAQKRLCKLFKKYTSKLPTYPKQIINLPSRSKILIQSYDINLLIKKILKSQQGIKWKNLHMGNLSGYQSKSEGAQAYIAITNYFAGGDEKLIKELFSRSIFPQLSAKYKQDYYIDRMINNAKNTLISNQSLKNRCLDTKEKRRKRF